MNGRMNGCWGPAVSANCIECPGQLFFYQWMESNSRQFAEASGMSPFVHKLIGRRKGGYL